MYSYALAHAGSTGSRGWPEKIFVLPRENKRPLKRLEKRVDALSKAFLHGFEAKSKQDYANFERTAKMVLQVASEIDVVKKVVETIESEVDETRKVALERRESVAQTILDATEGLRQRVKLLEADMQLDHQTLVKSQELLFTLQGRTEKQYNELRFYNTWVSKSIFELLSSRGQPREGAHEPLRSSRLEIHRPEPGEAPSSLAVRTSNPDGDGSSPSTLHVQDQDLEEQKFPTEPPLLSTSRDRHAGTASRRQEGAPESHRQDPPSSDKHSQRRYKAKRHAAERAGTSTEQRGKLHAAEEKHKNRRREEETKHRRRERQL